MQIDITALNQNFEEEIYVSLDLSFPKEILENSEILDLQRVHLEASVTLDEERNPHLSGTLTGEMVIPDSITLEEINYPFSIEMDEVFEENSKKFENTLDILDVLWQNIVLEVPLRFTKVTDTTQLQGEGWRLLDEESLTESKNPFKDLKDYFGEE